jgi:purine-binding chemotaxis protein CheW
MDTQEVVEQQQYLTFMLAGEEYAITIPNVRQIVEYHTVTRVPKTPKWTRGVINLRGAVVPVVDIAVKFGLEERPVTRTTCIIIIETRSADQNATIGVIADAVSQVIDLRRADIYEPPSFGTRVQVDYLLGMVPMGSKFVLLLNLEKVLSTEELVSLTHLPESTPQEQPPIGSIPIEAMETGASGEQEQHDAV